MFVLPLARSASLARRDTRAASIDTIASRLFDASFERYFGGADAGAETRTPAMDVAENDTSFIVTFEVPGTTREQLKVSVEGRRVALSTAAVEAPTADAVGAQPGAAKIEATPTERLLYRERRSARYARTVSLPAEVDQTTSQAKFDNGVLTLVLAKKVPAGATQLRIG